MKYKVYATRYADREEIKKALSEATIFFKDFAVQFSPIDTVKEKETRNSLYENIAAFTLLIVSFIKKVKISYVMDLPHEGYDGVILFVDKRKAKETESLYGAHTIVNGKSYIEVYAAENQYVKLAIHNGQEYGEVYQKQKEGTVRSATAHALIHEIYHSLSVSLDVPDILHAFIAEGQFDTYRQFLGKQTEEKKVEQNGYILYRTALSCLETDVTPRDLVPDVVACAETVNAVYQKAFGKPIGGLASTYNMYQALIKHPDFIRVDTPTPGDIVISPTGYSRFGGKTSIKNGHVGIVGTHDSIMSNDSPTGLFRQNYSIKTWGARYGTLGGYPVAFFRRK